MWVDSSGLCCHRSSFIHYIAWHRLSWPVRKRQTLMSQMGRRMMQPSAQTEVYIDLKVIFWCSEMHSEVCTSPNLHISICSTFLVLLVEIVPVSYIKLYLGCVTLDLGTLRSTATACKTFLHLELEQGVDRRRGNNRNNEQNKVTAWHRSEHQDVSFYCWVFSVKQHWCWTSNVQLNVLSRLLRTTASTGEFIRENL